MKTIDIEGIPIHYEDTGVGIPLVGIHGWATDHQYISSILEPVFDSRTGWRRIYPDLPGRGRTRGTEDIHSSADILRLLLGFIGAVVGEERFAVAGLSYGGLLARGVVSRMPENITGLLLIVPSLGAAQPPARLPRRVVLKRDETAFQAATPEERAIFENAVVIQDLESLNRLRTRFFPSTDRTDRAFLDRISAGDGSGFRIDDHRGFEGPTLFLLGRQDHVVGYRSTLDLDSHFPAATFAVIDRAGHLLAGVEQVEISRNLISEWVDRVHPSSERR